MSLVSLRNPMAQRRWRTGRGVGERETDRDRPTGRIRFSFSDTAEGTTAQQTLKEILEGDLIIGPSHARQADDVPMSLTVLD